ncbi:MAG: prolipoprotein diacylglyceryl transferase [Candidatus Limnocylindria bacterium]
MIELPFHPDLVLGPLRVAWHSVFSFVGLLAGSQVSVALARRLVRDGREYAFAAAVVLGGLAGARAVHVLGNWPQFADRPAAALAFWGGGIAVSGAPLGAAIGGLVAVKALRLPLGFLFDVSVIGAALGLAIGRVGDIVNGEHHAVACAVLPWCVRYTNPETLGQAHLVHPVVAYDLAWNLVIFTVLFAYWQRIRGRPPEGRVFWLFLVLYGGGRFLTSFLRLDPIVFAGLQLAQLLGLAYVAAGAAALWAAARRNQRRSRVAAGGGRATTFM